MQRCLCQLQLWPCAINEKFAFARPVRNKVIAASLDLNARDIGVHAQGKWISSG